MRKGRGNEPVADVGFALRTLAHPLILVEPRPRRERIPVAQARTGPHGRQRDTEARGEPVRQLLGLIKATRRWVCSSQMR